jgi:hypothetical protein
VLGDELPKSRDRVLDPGIGHVGQWDRGGWYITSPEIRFRGFVPETERLSANSGTPAHPEAGRVFEAPASLYP